VTIPVNSSDTGRDIVLQELSVASRTPNYTVRTRVTDDPPTGEGVPDTAVAGYLQVNHTVSDRSIDFVTFDVRVSRARLADRGIDPGNVALYRRHAGEWTELPAFQVGTEDGYYRYRADAPGLSVFAVGSRSTGRFAVTDLTLDRSAVAAGETVTATATVRNDGTATDATTLGLVVDGRTVETRQVAVPAGDTAQVTFRRSFTDPGTYTVGVGGRNATLAVETVTPTPTETPTPTVTPATDTPVPTRTETPPGTATPQSSTSGFGGSELAVLLGLLVLVAVGAGVVAGRQWR
jgi:PGF-pre-PGF domain-containing protein